MTWQNILHELIYLMSQESIAASTQRRANKYDFHKDMAKRSAWTDISAVPGNTAASTQSRANKYDGAHDMAKRSEWTDIIDVPGKNFSIYTTPV